MRFITCCTFPGLLINGLRQAMSYGRDTVDKLLPAKRRAGYGILSIFAPVMVLIFRPEDQIIGNRVKIPGSTRCCDLCIFQSNPATVGLLRHHLC